MRDMHNIPDMGIELVQCVYVHTVTDTLKMLNTFIWLPYACCENDVELYRNQVIDRIVVVYLHIFNIDFNIEFRFVQIHKFKLRKNEKCKLIRFKTYVSNTIT